MCVNAHAHVDRSLASGSGRNWKAGPFAGASNDKFGMKCRRLPDSSSYESRSYVWEGTAWKTRVAG